ncbi:hypothetical protein KIN20_006668 [Parelaphostrongylus tenuis]|uniref:Transmembrane protein 231 n=1 Tax=Parelaphostrongylus tenuis TaxID=148309 RepID=A0AAD5M249_PARTN|nr:hypothetical protein KIN20_006668 [Parelaphostrongylus tenuis]
MNGTSTRSKLGGPMAESRRKRLFGIQACFRSNLVMLGLWKKTGTYRERPHVVFDGRYVLLLRSGDQYSFSSTLPVLNSADNSHYSVSQLDYQWIPLPENNYELQLDIFVPMSNASFDSLIYFVFLNYHLDYHSDVEAEVALYDSLQLPYSTTSITVLGRLTPDQKQPFRWREYYELLNQTRRDAEYYKPSEIMRRITIQPFNVRLDRKMQLPVGSTLRDGQFHLKMNIIVAEDEFLYRCDLWELLKWAAVQYATVYLVSKHK